MFAPKTCLILLSVFGLNLVLSRRITRSPDKMEVDIPSQSIERESGEYQENMNQEAGYWHGQYQDKDKEGHEHLDEDRDKNQEQYEHEKEHYGEQQHHYHQEMNNTYEEDRDKAESHHHDNQEHYNHHHDNNSFQGQGNQTADNLQNEAEVGDRYEDMGSEYVQDRENQIQNYDVQDSAPSFSYTRG